MLASLHLAGSSRSPLVSERLRPLRMAVEGAGPGVGDYVYFAAVLALIPLIVGSVGSSLFVEGGGEADYPKIGLPGPLAGLMGGNKADPMEEAERLRLKLAAAVEAQEMVAAFATEKELKQHMMENGINFEFEAPEKEAPNYTQLPFPQEVVETGLAKEPIPGGTEAKAAEQSLRARRRGPDGGVRGPEAGTTR